MDFSAPTPDSPLISLPLASSALTIASSALPIPGIASSHQEGQPKKKSHARKQPPGHIPRPRNAFILFRCDFVFQKKVPHEIEKDHRNISRIAGRIWKEMSAEQQRPWVALAEAEKAEHVVKYPGYRYNPIHPHDSPGPREATLERGRKRRAAREEPQCDSNSLSGPESHGTPVGSTTHLHRRTSSCPPPGAIPVRDLRDFHAFATQDDLSARRPSSTTMYQVQPTGTPQFPLHGHVETPSGSPWHSQQVLLPSWTHGGVEPSTHGTNSGLHMDSMNSAGMANLSIHDTIFNDPFGNSSQTPSFEYSSYNGHFNTLPIPPTHTYPQHPHLSNSSVPQLTYEPSALFAPSMGMNSNQIPGTNGLALPQYMSNANNYPSF